MINVCRQAARENSTATSICRSTFCMTSRWTEVEGVGGGWGHHMQEHFTLLCQSVNYYSFHTRKSSSFYGNDFFLKLCTSELLFIYLFSEHVHDSASEHVEVIANSKSVSHMWTGELWRPERLQKSRPLLTFHPRTLAPKRQQ